ncbi:hypothetical protein RB594_002892 [Gaeumannomyces avenae]
MSIELNWETLTQGPDGDELKNRIRDFIHAKFQTVPLPRFIKSVTVHDFQFGSIPPELELKDITDPLPDFYEEDPDADYDDDDDDDDDESDGAGREEVATVHSGPDHGPGSSPEDHRSSYGSSSPLRPGGGSSSLDPGRWPRSGPGGRQPGGGGGGSGSGININTRLRGEAPAQDLTSPFLGTSTPGILSGGTSNFSYFHSHLASSGLSGTQTPLAAVAGAHRVHPPWLDVHGFRGGGNGGGRGGMQQQNQRDDSSSSRDSSRHKPAAGSPVLEVDGFTPSHSRHGSVSAVPDPAAAAAAAAAHEQAARRGSPPGVAGPGLAPLQPRLREKHSVSTLAPTSVGNNSRPPTREKPVAKSEDGVDDHNDGGGAGAREAAAGTAAAAAGGNNDPADQQHREDGRRFREQRIEDLQAVFRIRYAGDVRLLLTADILLDYPMPSFVGIPVRLSITGLTFDGVGVLAYIRKRVHFCFLSPEDAVAITGSGETEVGDDAGAEVGGGGSSAEGQTQSQQQQQQQQQEQEQQQQSPPPPRREGRSRVTSGASTVGGESTTRMGGLLQEIRVESEIGQRESGKQSLRNVGKVERFVLEQVRRIFEEEFVYPSFWTFLV